MPKFRVVAEISYLVEAEIEAVNLMQAQKMALDLDGGSFSEIESSGDWNIINVEEVQDV